MSEGNKKNIGTLSSQMVAFKDTKYQKVENNVNLYTELAWVTM